MLPIALGVGGLALLGSGCGDTSSASIHSTLAPRSRIAEEKPPRPKHLDVATPEQERAQASPRPPGSLPPASAGTNGSFVPPPPSKRKTITAREIAGLESGESAILLGGVALAPPSAPQEVKAAVSGANQIVGRPYIWGGGHRSWYSNGYDCSGAVSYALAAGGLLSAPLTSSQLEHWGAPGPGRWITVYANAGHAYAVIAGLRWDTVGDARGTGPRWHAAPAYSRGFVVRHPPGY